MYQKQNEIVKTSTPSHESETIEIVFHPVLHHEQF